MLPRPKCVKLVAEIGINHNGDMQLVRQLMEQAAFAGFQYVKFQKRDLELTVPMAKRDQPKSTPWGDMTYMEYKRRLELNADQYAQIDRWAKELGVEWFASPWDVNSVRFLAQFDIPFMKVASALLTDLDVLAEIYKTQVPIVMSTGMSLSGDVLNAVYAVSEDRVKYLLACTSTYPSEPAEQNLKFVETLRYDFPFARPGFSNHNSGILYAAASVCFGAEMIEIHVTHDRSAWGSDQAASIELEGMLKLNKYVRGLEQAIDDGRWKIYVSEEKSMRSLRKG